MGGVPDVSVVIGVYNGAAEIEATVASVLAQTGIALECVAVDDGSTDATGAILDRLAAADPRVRVIHQPNQGLTRALIAGCTAARARYIARQDAGDISLPGRLAAQAHLLDARPDVVMTSCGTRYVGPEGEFLYEMRQAPEDLQSGLADTARPRGPSHHGSTMFRRAAYEAVGGYRAIFRVAQDLDLWMRLAEIGTCVASPEVFYVASLQRGRISQLRRAEQESAAAVIAESARARRAGDPAAAEAALKTWSERAPAAPSAWPPRRYHDASFYYFLGCALRGHDRAQARKYFCLSLRSWALYPRAWYRLFELTLAR